MARSASKRFQFRVNQQHGERSGICRGKERLEVEVVEIVEVVVWSTILHRE